MPRPHTRTTGLVLVTAMAFVIAAFTAHAEAQLAPDPLRFTTDPDSGLTIEGFAPGDTTQWAATIENTGTVPVPVLVQFTVDDTGTPTLTSDTDNGLRVRVDQCSAPWVRTAGGTVGATKFECEGDQVTVADDVPVGATVADPVEISDILDAGDQMFVRAFISFPVDAGNDLAATSGVLRFNVSSSGEFTPPSSDPEVPSTSVPTSQNEPHNPKSPDAPTTIPRLPRTGAEMLTYAVLAAIAIAAGSVMVSAARKPSAGDDQEPVDQ